MTVKEKLINKSKVHLLASNILPDYFADKIKEPVFIIGSGRSGTSFLKTVLGQHPAIATYPTEANDLWHPNLFPYRKSKIEVPPIWIAPEKFTKKSLSTWLDGWEKKIKGVFGAYHKLSNRSIFVQKTVMTNFMLKEKLTLFPDAKFIHLFRNGLSVALSHQKKELQKYKHPRYDKYIDHQDFKQIRKLHAEYWNQIILEIEDFREQHTTESNFIELQYEKMAENPHIQIEKLMNFLGLEMSNNKSFQNIITNFENRNYKVKKELDGNEINELKDLMSEGLKMKGYQ